MAIYHFSAKVIGRSGGRSAVAAAAYRAAECLHDDAHRINRDYTAKAGVVHREILLPDGAPQRWLDRATLWNEVETGEKRKDAQLARDIEVSLPRELGKAEAIRLVQDFVREQFVTRGMVADLNVHWTRAADGGEQPHAHVMLSMRGVVPGADGHGAFGKKETAWNDRALLTEWRERWASLVNERLAVLGHDVRIDHRSNLDQGLTLAPQGKIGPAGMRRAQRGEDAERAREHEAIARRNGEAIIADPGLVLDAVTRQHATFMRADLARFVSRHTVDGVQFALALAKAEASPELVRLGTDERGRERFTTRSMLETERRMERAAVELSGRERHCVSTGVMSEALARSARAGLRLGDEQRAALRHVTVGSDLALVVGFAGTGKSAMLGVARQAWEAAGHRVRGAALSGIAAEGLEGGSGIASRTLASLEFAWKAGRELLTRQDVLVIDEAGLVGSRQLERVLSVARDAGAKVVLVGDPEQLQAIEAGAAFRALGERHGAAEISEIRRQRVDWQRNATRELATQRTSAALARYETAGLVRAAATREEAQAALVAGWDQMRRESPAVSQVILAYTKDDVRALNELARGRMRAAGALGREHGVQTALGKRRFASGDRLMFLQNERALGAVVGADGRRRGGVAVKNGTLGTVVTVEEGGGRLTVRLDRGGAEGGTGVPLEVTFSVAAYDQFDHGFAATTHKSQGVTVDRAHVLASQYMNRHAAYVALSRHRDGVVLHYGRDEFRDGVALARTLGRDGLKDSSLDYDEAALVRRHAERRGFDPLRPESAIVVAPAAAAKFKAVPVPVPVPEAQVAPDGPALRRGKFAGLKLGVGPRPMAPPAALAEAVPASAPAWTPEVWPELEQLPPKSQQIATGMVAYAKAWAAIDRMKAADLPSLPHQQETLRQARDILDAAGKGTAWYVDRALRQAPELVSAADQRAGLSALAGAVRVAMEEDIRLRTRGQEAVRAWAGLEREYEAAGKVYAWDAQRAVGSRMEAFAQGLKGDAELEGVLKQRGRQLGIAEGSRLDQVVRAAEVDWRLMRRIDVDHGLHPRPGMSPSPGM